MNTEAKSMPIGIFDSGVGGLSAVRAFLRLNPMETVLYFGDTARVPYGTKDDQTIRTYARQDLHFLLEQDVKAVLVACGTVSSVALDELRDMTQIPVFGIVDAAAGAAAETTRSGRIAVLATEATVRSGAFSRALRQKDAALEVLEVPCPLFVPLVENGYIEPDNRIARLIAEQYLEQVRQFPADTLILGCTHYPLLRPLLERLIPDAKIIDAGLEAAKQVTACLRDAALLTAQKTGESAYYTSGDPAAFSRIAKLFMGETFSGNVQRVE